MRSPSRRAKGTLALTTAAVLALGLAGCAPAAPSAPETITFMPVVSKNLNEALWNGIISDFEKANPTVTVTLVSPAGKEYTSYGKTLLAAGNFPDVVVASNADFVTLGALAPLDESLVSGFKNYKDTAIDDKYYSVPTAVQPQSLIFYNKDLFTKAGISAPPTTFDELTKDLALLKPVTPTPFAVTGEWTTGFQYGILSTPTVMGQTHDWFAQKAADKVSFADSAYADTAKLLADWNSKGYLGQGALSKTFDQGGKDFLAGDSAMYPMGVWFGATIAASKPPFEVGVFPVPTKSGEPVISSVLSLNYAVSSTSKASDGATKFVKFLTQNEKAVGAQISADGLFSNATKPVTYDQPAILKDVAALLGSSTLEFSSSNGLGKSVPPAGYSDFLNTSAQSLVLGQLDANGFVTGLDKWWSSNK